MAQPHPKNTDRETRARLAKYPLDEMNAGRIARHLVTFEPDETIVEELMAKARLSVPGLCPTSEMVRVLRHRPDSIMAVTRKTKFDPAAPAGEGLIAFLPLNLPGLQHLALGTFNAATPDMRLLVKPHERPAAVYLWLVYAPGPVAAGIAFFRERMMSGRCAGVPIYTRPATEAGRHYAQVLGFTQGAIIGDIEAPPNVWVFEGKSRAPHRGAFLPEDLGSPRAAASF